MDGCDGPHASVVVLPRQTVVRGDAARALKDVIAAEIMQVCVNMRFARGDDEMLLLGETMRSLNAMDVPAEMTWPDAIGAMRDAQAMLTKFVSFTF